MTIFGVRRLFHGGSFDFQEIIEVSLVQLSDYISNFQKLIGAKMMRLASSA